MKRLLIIFLLFFLVFSSKAQRFELNTEQTTLTVKGTSTLHDWAMQATELEGSAKIVTENGTITAIEYLTVTVPVRSLKSGTSGMDEDAYEALKADKFPSVKYEFQSIESQRKSGDELILATKGKLSIAGETRIININVVTDLQNLVTFTGDVSFQMTDFNIEPPTAMFGALEAGKKVTITFKASFTEK